MHKKQAANHEIEIAKRFHSGGGEQRQSSNK